MKRLEGGVAFCCKGTWWLASSFVSAGGGGFECFVLLCFVLLWSLPHLVLILKVTLYSEVVATIQPENMRKEEAGHTHLPLVPFHVTEV